MKSNYIIFLGRSEQSAATIEATAKGGVGRLLAGGTLGRRTAFAQAEVLAYPATPPSWAIAALLVVVVLLYAKMPVRAGDAPVFQGATTQVAPTPSGIHRPAPPGGLRVVLAGQHPPQVGLTSNHPPVVAEGATRLVVAASDTGSLDQRAIRPANGEQPRAEFTLTTTNQEASYRIGTCFVAPMQVFDVTSKIVSRVNPTNLVRPVLATNASGLRPAPPQNLRVISQ